VVRTLLIAFVGLCLARIISPAAVSPIMPAAVILFAWGMIVLAGIADSCAQVWFLYRERLQALCIGISIKLFDWRLGDVTVGDYPGRWWAIGPLRVGAKLRPASPCVDVLLRTRLAAALEIEDDSPHLFRLAVTSAVIDHQRRRA
jgi:hypothetical protein